MSVVTLLLLLVAMGVGIFFYRRKKSKPISENTQDEEEEEVLEEEEEEEMDAADTIAAEKKADIAIQETKRKVSVAASMAKKRKAEAAAAMAAKKKAEAEAREAKRKKDAQAALMAKKKAEAAAALAAKKKAEAEAYKRKLAKARAEAARKEAARKEAARKAREEAARKEAARKEAARKAREEAARKEAARKEAARKAREEAARKAREAEMKRKQEAARRAYEAEMKRKQEAARRAYEAEMKKQEEARKEAIRKEREAEAKRRREEAKKRREEAKKKREAAEAARKKLEKQYRELNNILYDTKMEELKCKNGSWNGVRLVLNGYRNVNTEYLWFSNMRRYSARKRGGDQHLTERPMIPKAWGWGGVRLDVKTKKIKFGWRRINSWPDTKTHISFGSGRWWRDKRTYNGHLFVDKNRLMIRKAKKFGRAPWAFYLKDVEIAKFKNNTHEECAIVAVSTRKTKKVLFVQSNNSKKSYDLVDRRWIDHPWAKCTTKEDLLKKQCDKDVRAVKPRCPPGYESNTFQLFANTKLCPPGQHRIVDKRTGKTRRCRGW